MKRKGSRIFLKIQAVRGIFMAGAEIVPFEQQFENMIPPALENGGGQDARDRLDEQIAVQLGGY